MLLLDLYIIGVVQLNVYYANCQAQICYRLDVFTID